MGWGNDGGRGGYEYWFDEDEERVSRSLVNMYPVRSAWGSSKSMGSSSSFRGGMVETHQLGVPGMRYSTCTVCVGERAKPPRVGEWDERREGEETKW